MNRLPFDALRISWITVPTHSHPPRPGAHHAPAHLAGLHRREPHRPADSRPDHPAGDRRFAGQPRAFGMEHGGRRGRRGYHGDGRVAGRGGCAAGRIGGGVHGAEAGRGLVPRLPGHPVDPDRAAPARQCARGRHPDAAEVRPAPLPVGLDGDGAEPQEHRLLRRLRAAVHLGGPDLRVAGRDPAADLRLPGRAECIDVRAGRPAAGPPADQRGRAAPLSAIPAARCCWAPARSRSACSRADPAMPRSYLRPRRPARTAITASPISSCSSIWCSCSR